jgi:hypothetical protein
MALGIQGFHLNNTELREYSHGLFASIAKVRRRHAARATPYTLSSSPILSQRHTHTHTHKHTHKHTLTYCIDNV